MAQWIVAAVAVVLAVLSTLFAHYLMPIEGAVDRWLQPIRDMAEGSAAEIAVVELRSPDFAWPPDRRTLALVATNALSLGAAAVGIEVDMSHPTSAAADDALGELVKRNPRIVPLNLVGARDNSGEPFGFVFDGNGVLKGIRCDDASKAFALRLALASGVATEALASRCSHHRLNPYLNVTEGRVPTIDVGAVLDGKAGLDLRGRAVLLGTHHPLTSLDTYSGRHSATFINASVVKGAMTDTWRGPDVTWSILVFSGLLGVLWLIMLPSRSDVIILGSCGLLMLALVLIRTWIWFPLSAATLVLALTAATTWFSRRRVGAGG
jgi:hypothetical protein